VISSTSGVLTGVLSLAGGAVIPVSISGTPPAGIVSSAYSFTPTTANGSGTKSFALTGTLPTGLNFSTTTGAITGTPTTVQTSSGLNITVTDSSGSAALGTFSIAITAALRLGLFVHAHRCGRFGDEDLQLFGHDACDLWSVVQHHHGRDHRHRLGFTWHDQRDDHGNGQQRLREPADQCQRFSGCNLPSAV
jgi:hypothetical protein